MKTIYICEICGEDFDNLNDCEIHEENCKKEKENFLNKLEKYPIKFGENVYEFVRFANEDEINLYEKYKTFGNNNIKSGWEKQKEKFNKFPIWMLCGYENLDFYYRAYYYTKEEVYNKIEEIEDFLENIRIGEKYGN